MKSFIVACIVAIVIAVVGNLVLDSVQRTVDDVYKTDSVRLGA